MPPPPRPRPVRFDAWEIGLIVAGAVLLGLTLIAIVYRILVILIGEPLAQLVLGLAAVLGFGAWFIAAVVGALDRRDMAAKRALAEREGRQL